MRVHNPLFDKKKNYCLHYIKYALEFHENVYRLILDKKFVENGWVGYTENM